MIFARGSRPRHTKEIKKRILVLCEGACTEPEYLHAIRRHLRVPEVNLRIFSPPDVPNTPKEMVARAKEIQKREKADPYDEVWCVFDVEAKATQTSRPGLPEALDAARSAKVQCAVSNPCFEIWLLWHEVEWTAAITSENAQKECRNRGITCGKHIEKPAHLTVTGRDAARQRANDATQRHERDGKTVPEEMNPSSGIYRLIDAIVTAFPSVSQS